MEMNETLRERQQLAYERIRQIAADPEINGAVGDYFQKTGKFALLILKARELAEEDYFAKASVDDGTKNFMRILPEMLMRQVMPIRLMQLQSWERNMETSSLLYIRNCGV